MAGKPSTDERLKILGLERGATPNDYRQAYKDLVEVWHPDRFAHNERLRLMANERMKEINEAFVFLMEQWRTKGPSDSLSLEAARARVLCVDDEILVLKGLARQLSLRFDVVTAASAQAALDTLLGEEEVAVILSDLMMPDVDGIAFLRQAMTVSPQSTRILLTGHMEAISMAVALDRHLLFRILDKSCDDDLLFDTVQQGVDAWRARNERAALGHSTRP
jgi:CheY-like chemotaxis protein